MSDTTRPTPLPDEDDSTPENATADGTTPASAADDAPDDVPEAAPEDTPEDTPGIALEGDPEHVVVSSPEDAPESAPEKAPEPGEGLPAAEEAPEPEEELPAEDPPTPVREAPERRRTTSAAWTRFRRVLAPRATRAQLMAALLCVLVGFALVVQVQQNRTDGLSGLRQDELVRILDEVTQRSDELESEVARLRQTRSELVTGSDTQRAAHEAALRRAEVQGILAGALPATGPGIELRIGQADQRISAGVLYNLLEELRNAGAEAIQVNDVRLTASSYFVDTADGVEVDGITLRAPYLWLAIGDPDTITVALSIPGGALATVRSEEGTTSVVSRDELVVDALRTLRLPRYATPVPVVSEE